MPTRLATAKKHAHFSHMHAQKYAILLLFGCPVFMRSGPDLEGIVLSDRYGLQEAIGRGGTAMVYRAQDRRLSGEVAVKVLYPEHARVLSQRRRFLQEALLGGQLRHEHLIPVLDMGTEVGPGDDYRTYFVMPLVPGPTLREMVLDGPIHWIRCIKIAVQLLRGIAELHRNGALHRDLKLTNCIVERRADGGDCLRILDYGLAKVHWGALASGSFETTSGVVLGTLPYLAPERILRVKADQRADLYSVGVMLYELLTRRQPFEGSEYEVLTGHVSGVPVDPSVRCPERRIPESLSASVLRCLAKNPADRCASAIDYIEELEAILVAESYGFDSPEQFLQAGAYAARAGIEAWRKQDYAQALACALDAGKIDFHWRGLYQIFKTCARAPNP